MTFASHVVTTAPLKCHILTKIFITIYFFILTWYKHISDRIFWFNCVSMKSIFLREGACFAGLASDNSNMSTWSSHLCFTTRVIYKHETGGCEVMFTMVYISLQNVTHFVWSMQHIDFYCIFASETVLSFICRKKRNYDRNIYIATCRSIRNFGHIDAYQCKTLLI